MLMLIHSDLYRLFHRPYLYILTAIICALAIFFNFMFSASVSISRSFQFSLNYFKFLLVFEVIIVDMAMAEENKFGTLKNTISSGFNRNQVYAGKWVTSFILTIFCIGIAFLFYLGSAFLHMKVGSDFSPTFIGNYLLRIVVALLLMIGAIFVAMVFSVVIQKNVAYIFSFIGFILILPLVFEGFGIRMDVFRMFYSMTLFGQAEGLYDIKNSQLFLPVLVAVLHMISGAIIGIKIFGRQDVN